MHTESPSPIVLTGSYKYYRNISYGKFNRNTIDLFVPDSPSNVPCVMHYHGGGFVFGATDPTQYPQSLRNEIQAYLDAGIAFAYVNYRLLAFDGERENLLKSLECGVQSVNYFKSVAINFGIDNTKICLAGQSAGCGLIMHNLHYGTSSVKAIVLESPQATYDPLEPILTNEVFDIVEDMETYVNSKKTYLRGCGVKNISDLQKATVVEYRSQVNYVDLPLTTSFDEAYIETLNQPTPLENNPTLVTHHYQHCISIHEKFTDNSLTSFLNIPTAPSPLTVINPESKVNFIIRNLTN